MTIATAPVCVGASSCKRSTLPTQLRMARISPRSIVKYFSGEEGALSEMCFDGSEDELSMEGEDPHDPLYSPQAGTINILQTKETKKYYCFTNIQVFLHLWEAVLCRPSHLDQQKVKIATQKNSLRNYSH